MATQGNNDLVLRMITFEGRVCYPHLFKAAQVMGKGEAKYSMILSVPKDQELVGTDLDGNPITLKQLIRNAKIAAFGPDKKNWPEGMQSPVIDGDAPKYAGKEGYEGCWLIKAASNEAARPGVVDAMVKPITDPAQFYPGCYARMQIFARVWEYMGKQGVHFILDHVQKTRDGKSFGGKKAASEVFQPITSVAGAEDDEDDTESFM